MRPIPLVRALPIVVLLALGVGCGSGEPAGGPTPDATAAEQLAPEATSLRVERGAPLGRQQSTPAPGEVKLWVSNQSFDDDPVRLRIAIDGTQVVDESFAVEGQHNWIAFDIAGLAAGRRTITAESDTGAHFTGELTVVADEPRWLVLDYWYHPDDPQGRHFTFQESVEAVAFA